MSSTPKSLSVTPLAAPEALVNRGARPAREGEKKTRYHLPSKLSSASPVGYRTRVALSPAEGEEALRLLSLARPTAFVAAPAPPERALFDEVSLGVLSARQATNFRGQRETLLVGADSDQAVGLLRRLKGAEVVLDGASHTHVVFTRPYRTPFTFLLTFIGHQPVRSLATVPVRALRKRLFHAHDIPSIGYMQHLHVGILADAIERAAVIASGDRRQANVILAPFSGEHARENREAIAELEKLAGLSKKDRAKGWRVALVAQVGAVAEDDRVGLSQALCRKVGANLLAFRSERIQPGVNNEERAPAPYQTRQGMHVPDELTVMAGRAAYNAFAHWTGVDRERAKDLVLLDRIDVLTPGGKERLRAMRRMLDGVTDRVVATLPKWADLPMMKLLSKSALRGKKAFALAGQRIYVGGLSPREIAEEGMDWELALRAFGAAAARSALVGELMGVVDLPDEADLLAGVCLMGGPINQNDIGKQFYGLQDMLFERFPDRDPTSLLIWTLKAKTVADPIGNEEQLLNAKRKGALVDLRPGPHEVVTIREGGRLTPMRKQGDKVNRERAFADVGNFVTGPGGEEIEGNRGVEWSR